MLIKDTFANELSLLKIASLADIFFICITNIFVLGQNKVKFVVFYKADYYNANKRLNTYKVNIEIRKSRFVKCIKYMLLLLKSMLCRDIFIAGISISTVSVLT